MEHGLGYAVLEETARHDRQARLVELPGAFPTLDVEANLDLISLMGVEHDVVPVSVHLSTACGPDPRANVNASSLCPS